jgi:hypothetical protein
MEDITKYNISAINGPPNMGKKTERLSLIPPAMEANPKGMFILRSAGISSRQPK